MVENKLRNDQRKWVKQRAKQLEALRNENKKGDGPFDFSFAEDDFEEEVYDFKKLFRLATNSMQNQLDRETKFEDRK